MASLKDWSYFLKLLGVDFFTDDDKLFKYLFQTTGITGYKYDADKFEEEFPGVKEAAVAAIRDIEKKNLKVDKLVYLNGIMQAWCHRGFGDPVTGLPHPPGKLCPNGKLYPVECR